MWNHSDGIVSALTGALVAQAASPSMDGISEKLTIGGAAALMLWWILGQQTKKLEELTQAIKELTQFIRSKHE